MSSVRLETLSTLDPNLGEKDPEKAVATAARGLEAMFLRQLLGEMRRGQKQGMLDGGYAGGVFRQMFDEQIADEMAKSGGIGLSESLAAQLQGQNLSAGRSTPGAATSKAAALRVYSGVQASETTTETSTEKNSQIESQDRASAVEAIRAKGGR